MYNGTAMISALGANITDGSKMGGQAIATMLKIATLCNDEQADTIHKLVKSYGTAEKREFEKYLGTYGAQLYVDVMEDKRIEATDEVLGAHCYAMSDSLTLLGPSFGLALSMSSSRTNKYQAEQYHYAETEKDLGAYNGNLWFARDGMLTLYTNNYQMPDNYWDYVNAMRVPGTTVDNRDRTNMYVIPYNGITNYAGAAAIGNNAVAAMLLANNNAEYLSDLRAKKAWFVFDNKIVCLGADINSSTVPDAEKITENSNIETVIENVFVKETTEFQFGTEDYRKLTNKEVAYDNGLAMFVFQYGGIYVPSTNNGTLKTKLNKTDIGNYIELWLEHGLTVEGGSYEYAIYPFADNMKAANFYEIVGSSETVDYEVIANTADVQAVKDKASDTTGYVFWKGGSINGITVNFACTVLVKVVDNQVTIAISDFSHNSPDNKTETATVTIDGAYTVVSADSGVTVEGNTITVDRTVAADGHTLTVVLSK